MSYNSKNHMKQGGDEWVVNGKLAFGDDAVVTGLDGATVASAATAAALGGVKAATKGAGDTVEIKIDASTAKLYAPTYPVLGTATDAALGGIKAGAKGEGDTVEIKVDAASSKLYAPAYPQAELVDDATDTDDVVAQLNALLAALIDAGLMASE